MLFRSDRAWQWIGYGKKVDAKQLLIKNFELDIDYIMLQPELGTLDAPRPKEQIRLTVEAFKMWGMMANTPQGKEVRRYFLACERTAKAQVQQLPAPAEPKALPTVPEMSKRNQARKLVDEQASKSRMQHSWLYQQAYNELEYCFGYPIAKSRAKNKLEKIEKDGQIDNLLAVMHKLWG